MAEQIEFLKELLNDGLIDQEQYDRLVAALERASCANN